MKRQLLSLLLSLILLAGFMLNASAQREVIIEGYPISGGGDITAFTDVITTALDADAANRETDPDVVYILKRDHLYPNATTIKNTFTLRMKAEEGPGALPALIMATNSQGNYQRFLEAQADCYFENIQFENQQADGGIRVRSQRLVANGIRGEFRGCVFYQDGGGAITLWGDSISVFVYDCFAHSIGRRGENNSNGRFVDTRMDNWCDTVVIQNCSADHLNGAFFRSGSAITGYLKIDHNTSWNNRDATISLYRAKEAIVTNNLFMNFQMRGDTPSYIDPSETNPDNMHAYELTIDTVWDASKITVRNNNFFYTQDVKDMWAKYDTIYMPPMVHPLIMRTLGADSVNAAFSEVVTFASVCDPPIAYMDAIFADMSAGTFPNQLCLGGADGGLFPDQVDASYETTSVSYTAADDGFPLGDLNWFPEMKARWEAGESPVGLKNMNTERISIYPNPARDVLFIRTGERGQLQLSVYDLLGKEVRNFSFSGGNAEINVSQLFKGLYIYRISDPANHVIQSGKLMIAK